MQEFIVSVMNHYGYAGVFMLILAENLFPPIPSEVILPFSGFMTTYTNMTVWGVVFFSTIGSTLGALILYGIGTLLCMSRLEKIMDSRVCRILGFQKEKIKKTMGWFEKKGMAAVLLGRCVPMIRSLISIPAGMAKMKILTFLLYTVIGSTIWNLALVSLGAALGASWGYIQEWISAYSEMTGTVLKIVFFAWIGWKLIRNLLKRRS
ncbi:MAG: DedA family protein [Lachnospiraceae bacterium]|nr:DedA family protein [Lachnospiraceae bacterium]